MECVETLITDPQIDWVIEPTRSFHAFLHTIGHLPNPYISFEIYKSFFSALQSRHLESIAKYSIGLWFKKSHRIRNTASYNFQSESNQIKI